MAKCKHRFHANQETDWNYTCRNCGMVLPRGSFFSVVSNLMDENAELRHEIADLQGQADVYKGAKEVIDELRQRVQTLQTALANLYRAIMYAGSLDDVHNDGMGTTMADAQAALKEQADE